LSIDRRNQEGDKEVSLSELEEVHLAEDGSWESFGSDRV